ncbi:serine/threonine-protein kinase MARK1-like [Pteronotus mesoamericanus]|uniref:serine/threonine-protein kinase MARK1-like n=1 Tax=Pteronotus mesoamericanus TaxID=1884717 RepID=UPI0023ED64CA|nr:serine/threonine-protein kinase MARK1-like [Pteronotus parnellii mesoamericanus]
MSYPMLRHQAQDCPDGNRRVKGWRSPSAQHTEKQALRTHRLPKKRFTGDYTLLRTIGKRSLAKLHRHGRRSEGEARAISRQLVSAVQRCHQQGVVHQDLKPENILMDGDRNVKLANFGLARVYTKSQLSSYCGAVAYVAPEILMHQTYDGTKVDVWSLGVVLYRMLVGDFPFVGDTYGKMKKAILSGKVSLPCFLSKEGKNLFKMLLILYPRRRPTLRDIMSDPWINMGQEQELRLYSEPPGGSNNGGHGI